MKIKKSKISELYSFLKNSRLNFLLELILLLAKMEQGRLI